IIDRAAPIERPAVAALSLVAIYVLLRSPWVCAQHDSSTTETAALNHFRLWYSSYHLLPVCSTGSGVFPGSPSRHSVSLYAALPIANETSGNMEKGSSARARLSQIRGLSKVVVTTGVPCTL